MVFDQRGSAALTKRDDVRPDFADRIFPLAPHQFHREQLPVKVCSLRVDCHREFGVCLMWN
jgi:hypothetical protein